MPELPELEIVREVLERRAVGQTITAVQLIAPGSAIVLRDLTTTGFEKALIRRTIASIHRRGKFLVFDLGSDPAKLFLAINPKLTGRLQLASDSDKLRLKTHLILTLSSGDQLRYFDLKQMGQLYLNRELEAVPGYSDVGPEPLEISLDVFRDRLTQQRGEIKAVLTRGEFVAGIGNAYADEILWQARLHPYRKTGQLDEAEVERLYAAMRSTLQEAIDKVRSEMKDNIHLKPREFMAVHNKTGEPCPRCGNAISLVGANDRITNFCRTCQPGEYSRG